jgi:hypothetical protein
VPIRCSPSISLDLYTQNGGKGSNISGGNFAAGENMVLYVDLNKNGTPIGNQAIMLEIVGPSNQYQNVTALLVTVTNSSGIGLATFTIPAPAEHLNEIVVGTWAVQAQTGLDYDTTGDTMNLLVLPLNAANVPEFQTWAFLALTFLLTTMATIVISKLKIRKCLEL